MLLTMNNDMKIFKAKPFEFVKESTDTLQVHLTTAVSRAQSYEKTTTEVILFEIYCSLRDNMKLILLST